MQDTMLDLSSFEVSAQILILESLQGLILASVTGILDLAAEDLSRIPTL